MEFRGRQITGQGYPDDDGGDGGQGSVVKVKAVDRVTCTLLFRWRRTIMGHWSLPFCLQHNSACRSV